MKARKECPNVEISSTIVLISINSAIYVNHDQNSPPVKMFVCRNLYTVKYSCSVHLLVACNIVV